MSCFSDHEGAGALWLVWLGICGASLTHGILRGDRPTILATLAKLLAGDAGAKRGLISVCTAGGMGVTAIVER